MEQITLSPDHRREIVLHIIRDAIILEGIYSSMNQVKRICSPGNDEEWRLNEWPQGIYNAFPLMGYYAKTMEEEEKILPIMDELYRIFSDMAEENEKGQVRKKADILAKHVLIEWEVYLQEVDRILRCQNK